MEKVNTMKTRKHNTTVRRVRAVVTLIAAMFAAGGGHRVRAVLRQLADLFAVTRCDLAWQAGGWRVSLAAVRYLEPF